MNLAPIAPVALELPLAELELLETGESTEGASAEPTPEPGAFAAFLLAAGVPLPPLPPAEPDLELAPPPILNAPLAAEAPPDAAAAPKPAPLLSNPPAEGLELEALPESAELGDSPDPEGLEPAPAPSAPAAAAPPQRTVAPAPEPNFSKLRDEAGERPPEPRDLERLELEPVETAANDAAPPATGPSSASASDALAATLRAEPSSAATARADAPLRALPELPVRGETEILRQTEALLRAGGGTAHLRLDPPELGGVQIHVRVHADSVQVQFVAEQAPVADLFARHGHELRSALEAQGLRVERFDVSGGGAGARDARDFSGGTPREEREPPRGSYASAYAAPSAAPLRARAISLGAIDLRV